jgi:hypothetical protein
MITQGKTRQDSIRQYNTTKEDKVKQGEATQDETRRDKTRKGNPTQDWAGTSPAFISHFTRSFVPLSFSLRPFLH